MAGWRKEPRRLGEGSPQKAASQSARARENRFGGLALLQRKGFVGKSKLSATILGAALAPAQRLGMGNLKPSGWNIDERSFRAVSPANDNAVGLLAGA
jgi:hypothetical protein